VGFEHLKLLPHASDVTEGCKAEKYSRSIQLQRAQHSYISALRCGRTEGVPVTFGAMLQASSGCDSNMEASPSREQERNRSHHAGFGRGSGGGFRRKGTPIPVLPPRVPTPVPSTDIRYVYLIILHIC
jgi:hypothetical protein